MSGQSNIEWTEQTWNPIVGCTIVSPGCTNCYAMKMAARIEAINAALPASHGHAPQYSGTTRKVNGKAVWTGKLGFSESALLQPLRRKKPTTYFVNSMGDLFHEDCPDEWIDKVFAVMALCPQHTFQVLTKRPERMREYCATLGRHHTEDRVSLQMKAIDARGFYGPRGGSFYTSVAGGWAFKNVWLGVSTERQQEADERIPHLLQTPAAIRFVSCEPLLGPIDLTRWVDAISLYCIQGHETHHVLASEISYIQPPGENIVTAYCPKCGSNAAAGLDTRLDWIICGGESGKNARPMHPDWARSLRDQCAAAGVPFFFKQWGEWLPGAQAQHLTDSDLAEYKVTDLQSGGIGSYVFRVGKKKAGRLLDGKLHDAMPSLASASATRGFTGQLDLG